jgi:hypothetical protein
VPRRGNACRARRALGLVVRAEATDTDTTAVCAEPARIGARLPHDRLTCPFLLERPALNSGHAGSDQRSHLATRSPRPDQRPGNGRYPECAKLPNVHRAYDFFYGYSPGTGEEARTMMR